MFILSDTPVLDCSLRKSFDELVSICKNPINSSEVGKSDTESVSTPTSAPICDDGFEELKKGLCLRIQAYLDNKLNYLSEKDKGYITSMLYKVKSCTDHKSLIQLESEWNDKQKEK